MLPALLTISVKEACSFQTVISLMEMAPPSRKLTEAFTTAGAFFVDSKRGRKVQRYHHTIKAMDRRIVVD